MNTLSNTLNYMFEDLRHEDGLSGVVVVSEKNSGNEVAYFRYVLIKEDGKDSLTTKIARLNPIKPTLAFDEQFKYEFTFFTKELFPKTFTHGIKFSIPTAMNVKLRGYATMVKTDEEGNPVLDEHGNPIMENKPFEA